MMHWGFITLICFLKFSFKKQSGTVLILEVSNRNPVKAELKENKQEWSSTCIWTRVTYHMSAHTYIHILL